MSVDKRPAEIFAGLILAGQLDNDGGGYDGLEIQELLIKAGLCRQVTATKACGAIATLSRDIRILAHHAWTDPKNAEYLFREIGKRAQKIGELCPDLVAEPTPGVAPCAICGVSKELHGRPSSHEYSVREVEAQGERCP